MNIDVFGEKINNEPFKRLFIRFENNEDFDDFCKRINMDLTTKMKKVVYINEEK